MIEFPLGGTGQFAERVVNNIEAIFSEEEEFNINRLAIVRKFVSTSETFQDSNRYFRNKEELEIIEHELEAKKQQTKAGEINIDNLNSFREDNSKILSSRLIASLKRSETKISDLRSKKKLLSERPDTRANRDRIKVIKDKILAQQIRFNTQYNTVMLDRGFIRSMLGEK
jgi:hypothetical protein